VRRTPLNHAAFHGHLEIVQLLCDCGADVEARSRGRHRPLLEAAKSGHISVVKELVEERNADINASDVDWFSPLAWARISGNVDVAAYLTLHGSLEFDMPEDAGNEDSEAEKDDEDE
jgi:ankyrin repeat protein